MISILIVEDSESQRAALREFLEGLGKSLGGESVSIYAVADLSGARAVLEERSLDLVVSDLMLPDGTGLDLLAWIQESKVQGGKHLPFLILTGQPSIETAVEAIRKGASDYLLKPVDLSHLKVKCLQLLENSRLRQENRQLRARLQEQFHTGRVIGNSTALRELIERVKQIAPTDVTVLLEGESGTGKEMIANLIHENSNRSGRPFIRVNCGALTKTILESELFGSVKGAYTGSDRDRPGFFEAANGGTIFLDEIGEMDLESQVRLLRVIEEREVVRVGSTKPIKVDVRILSATNRSLLDEVDAGKFREDLYYRLAVIRLSLPPLRRRPEDIPLLFNHFVTEFNEKYLKSVTTLSPDLLKFFQAYDWPGNIRQFRNVLEAMVVLAREDVLTKEDLPPELTQLPRRATERRLADSVLSGISMEDYEKAIIEKNLAATGGNREKTAKVLGISARTLYRKLAEYGL